MISFKEYFLLREAKFSQSKKVIPVIKLPMFSVFLFKDDVDKVGDVNELKEKMRIACAEARKIITKMGFPSMHSNILIRDLSMEKNYISGGGVAGQAHRKGKYMSVSLDQINNPNYLIKTIVHEWAHLWMFNNSKGFKNAVKEYYKELLNKYKHFIQDRGKKEPFKNITRYKNFNETEKIVGREYSDDVYTIVVKKLMNQVEWLYSGYIDNKYAEDSWDFKEDENTFIKKIIESYINEMEKLIREIIDNLSEITGYRPNMEYYSKQIKYLANSITKMFHRASIKRIQYSVEGDENDYKWAKKQGEEWTRRISLLEYLHTLTDGNKSFLTNSKMSYNDIRDKFENIVLHLKRAYDLPSMVINLTYGIMEDTIKQKEFPQTEDKLVGEYKEGHREEMKNLVKWANSYGMGNDDELWATGVEEFLTLPPNHRKAILKLMSGR